MSTREFACISAGHPPLILQRANNPPETLPGFGLPIGVVPQGSDYETESLVLAPGDRLVIYSDGVLDTANADGELYGSERLQEFVSQNQHSPLAELAQAALADLTRWRGSASISDDVSLIAIEARQFTRGWHRQLGTSCLCGNAPGGSILEPDDLALSVISLLCLRPQTIKRIV